MDTLNKQTDNRKFSLGKVLSNEMKNIDILKMQK